MDAKDPEIVVKTVTPKISSSESTWKAKAIFSVPSPMCTIKVSFAQEISGKKNEKPGQSAYGSLETIIIAEDLLEWYEIMDPVDEDGNPMMSGYDLGQIKINVTRDILKDAGKADADDTGKELAEGWEAKVTPEGRIFYVNENTGISQWNHPAMNDQPLPDGWAREIDAQGRIFYVDTKSGKAGDDESHTIQYTNPSESPLATAARHSTIELQHDVTRILKQKLNLNEPSIERDSMQSLAMQRSKLQADKVLLQDPNFKTYEGRLRTFVRPMAIQMSNGVEFDIGGWPHGFHLVSDRPNLSALLKQQAVETTGSIKDVHFTSATKLLGIIPILEGFAYVRAGDSKSSFWDRVYLELRQIADGVEDEILLMWGHLEPYSVHKTKNAMQAVGYFNSRMLTKVSSIALTSMELDNILTQHSSLYRTKNLYGLELESGSDSMRFAFLDPQTRREWDSNLKAPQMQRLGRLSPEIMARAGFTFAPRISEGKSDRCVCPFCGLDVHGWKETDDAMEMHTQKSRKCAFVTGKHKDHDMAQLIAGLGSADPFPSRISVFTTPHLSITQHDAPHESSSAALNTSGALASYLGRDILGVEQQEHQESIVMKLQRTVRADRESLQQGTEAPRHQQALMEHRRRMHTVMHGDDGGRLLEMAAANQLEQVEALLDEGAPIGFVDGGMRTALHWAAAFGHDKVVALLIDRGANPNCKTVMGVTPLTLAEKGGYVLCAYHIEVNGGVRGPAP